jgi:hypothetical protein
MENHIFLIGKPSISMGHFNTHGDLSIKNWRFHPQNGDFSA